MIKVYLNKTEHQILDINCIWYKVFLPLSGIPSYMRVGITFNMLIDSRELFAKDNTIMSWYARYMLISHIC